MSLEQVITVKAADSGLTIAELRQFLDEFDKAAGPAHSLTATDGPEVVIGWHGMKPKARVGLGGGIKSITVTIPGGPGEEGRQR